MTEPSEAWLDWHFGTQKDTYVEEDLPSACQSDRVIMTRWMKVFEKAPPNQKLARNSLMLLMHGHVEDFGFLRAPFTDAMNCNRDLNEVLNAYKGISLLKSLKNARSKRTGQENKGPQRLAGGRTLLDRPKTLLDKRISSRAKLDPIKEVSEHSSVTSLEVKVITQKIRRSFECSDSPTMSVKEKIQAIEKELFINNPLSLRVDATQNVQKDTHRSFCNDPEASSSNRDAIPLSHEPRSQQRKHKNGSTSAARKPLPLRAPSTVNVRKYTHQRFSSDTEDSSSDHDVDRPAHVPHYQGGEPRSGCRPALRNLHSCFQEISERLRNSSENDSPVLGKIRAMAPRPERIAQKSAGKEDLLSKTRKSGGQAIPMSYERDKTLMDLLRRQEEVRKQCLDYYNLDGSLKDDSELPAPTSMPEKKIEVFSVGACRAMERLRLWRGKPNQLKFFRTLFRECGLETDVTGRVKALDRRFEQVAVQWLRSKRRHYPDQRPSQSLDKLLDTRHQLEKEKAYKKEYLAHLTEIRKLCNTHCRGSIRPDVLEKMLRCVDKHYEAVNGDVEGLCQQLEQMFSATWSCV